MFQGRWHKQDLYIYLTLSFQLKYIIFSSFKTWNEQWLQISMLDVKCFTIVEKKIQNLLRKYYIPVSRICGTDFKSTSLRWRALFLICFGFQSDDLEFYSLIAVFASHFCLRHFVYSSYTRLCRLLCITPYFFIFSITIVTTELFDVITRPDGLFFKYQPLFLHIILKTIVQYQREKKIGFS